MRRSGHQSALQKEKEDRPRTLCMAITRNREEAVGKPDVILDIKEVADIKMNALKAHRTQTEGMLRELEEKIKNNEPVLQTWFEEEVYWTYPWKD